MAKDFILNVIKLEQNSSLNRYSLKNYNNLIDSKYEILQHEMSIFYKEC